MKMEMVVSASVRSMVRDMIIYFVVGLGCLFGSEYVANAPWHDALLLISGVLFGGAAAFLALLATWHTQGRTKEVAEEQDQND